MSKLQRYIIVDKHGTNLGTTAVPSEQGAYYYGEDVDQYIAALREELGKANHAKKDLADAVQHYESYCLPELMEASVLIQQLATLRQSEQRLREALEWYANKANYDRSTGMDPAYDTDSDVQEDLGEKARAALAARPGAE